MSSTASRHDGVLEKPRRGHHEELDLWVRGPRVLSSPTDAVGFSEIESLSDSYYSGGGIGADILEITDSSEPIVVSICGRDRRLHIG